MGRSASSQGSNTSSTRSSGDRQCTILQHARQKGHASAAAAEARPPLREEANRALTRVEVVARAGAVKAVPEEVCEDLAAEAVGGAPAVVDVRTERGILGETRDLGQRVADGEQDAVHLRVLVCCAGGQRRRWCSSEHDSMCVGGGGGAGRSRELKETGGAEGWGRSWRKDAPMNMSALGTL